MATPAAVATRIDRFLRASLGDVEDVPALAEKWNLLPELERVTFSLEWDQVMVSYLVELDEHYRRGLMSPDQEVSYRELLRKLKDALPMIERLNLYRPPVSLES